MSGSREEWLQQRHGRWQTPPGVIAEVVLSATGSDIIRINRIIEGESNETYRVTTRAGDDLVIKVQHNWPGAYPFIARHAELLRSVGVAAPEILLRTTVPVEAGERVCVVQRFLEGTPLKHLVGTIPDAQVRALSAEGGELLARIHSILDDGEADLPSVEQVRAMHDALPFVESSLVEQGVDPAALVGTGERHAGLLDAWPRCLTHGDFSPEHLLVKDGRAYGVIDLDSTTGDSPLADISWWDTYFGWEPHPTSALLQGYRRVTPIEDVAVATLVFNLLSGVDKLAYFVREADPHGASFMTKRLGTWLEQLERV